MVAVWEFHGMDRLDYIATSWEKKVELIRAARASEPRREVRIVEDAPAPVGGYLLAAWCAENAARHTITAKFPQAVFEVRP